MEKLSWSKAEICKLFAIVEDFKVKNLPLLHAFNEFATKFGRKTNSVRNYYYSQLKSFEKAPDLCQKWGINLAIHKKTEQKFFSESELSLSMDKVESLLKKGYSVRRACYEVASGDMREMLRLQNKYQSRKNKIKNPKLMDNVLIMPGRKSALSESDISSLFLGLVRLVKKSAEESLEKELLGQVQSANGELRKSIKMIAEKEREVKLLRKKFELLSSEKNKLREEIKVLRTQNVELLKPCPVPVKMNNLKNYVQKLGKKNVVKSE